MALRTIVREITDFPATVLLSFAWIVVFAAMVYLRMQENATPTWWRLLVLGMGEGHRFGDLTLQDLARGQYWRLVTSTFVHYSVVHIVLNLLAFYLLGTLVESWYGTPQFVLIYGLTGGMGNLISALIRTAIGAHPLIHSGGGSVVIMGLIGLCGVVGFRSPSEREHGLGWQMSKALGLTGLLGVAFPRYIDNWGHAGGVVSGVPLGLFHGWFLRNRGRPSAWGMGMVAGATIVACGLAQVASDRREAGARRELAAMLDRRAFDLANRSIRVVGMLGERLLDPRLVVEVVGKDAEILGPVPARGAYRQVLSLAVAALTRKLSAEEQTEFDLRLAEVSYPLLTDLAPYLDKGATREPFLRAKAMVLEAQSRVLSDAEKAQLKECIAPLVDHIQRELATRIREYWKEKRAQPRHRPGAA
jgi:membrane associated rhomboid family serine protease